MIHFENAPKKATNLTLNAKVLEMAKSMGMNISQTVDALLAEGALPLGVLEQRMDAWSETFRTQFGQSLDFGMGLHAGRVALGQVGYEDTTTFSAVGEVVNTASRLQDHSKVVGARLVLSLESARLAGVADALGKPEEVQVRGRSQPLQVLHVKRPSQQWGPHSEGL